MKKEYYNAPEFEIDKFTVEEVISTSGNDGFENGGTGSGELPSKSAQDYSFLQTKSSGEIRCFYSVYFSIAFFA